MSSAIELRQAGIQVNSTDELEKLAKIMAASGFFEDAKSIAQCAVKILAGIEIGIPAFASLTGVHIIKGKPTIGANLMAAKVKASGRYNYKVKTLTGELCEIEFFENKESLGISSFSKAEAVAAGTGSANSMFQKFPRNMLFARAISNGVRFYCPDIFLGVAVYTPEEMGAEVNSDGDLINVSVVPDQRFLESGAEEAGNPTATGKISRAQITRLWAIATTAGWTKPALKAYLEWQYQLTTTTDISTAIYEDLCEFVKDEAMAKAWIEKTQTEAVEIPALD